MSTPEAKEPGSVTTASGSHECRLRTAATSLAGGKDSIGVNVREACFDEFIAAQPRAMADEGLLPEPGRLRPVGDDSTTPEEDA